jgi:NitT/TauT family transport system permease protein
MSVGRGRDVDIVELVKPVASITGLVILWSALVEAGVVGELPGPMPVAVAAVDLVVNPEVHASIVASLRHIYIPYVLAVVVGVPLGIAIGWSRNFNDLVFPSLELLRPVPPIAWLPIVILVFPTTIQGIMFITFLGAFFPIILNTISGVRSIDEDYVRAVRCLGGSRWQVIREVVVPAALPSIHTGLIVGMGLAWINLVAAEMIASEGLGRFVWVSYTSSTFPNILFSVLVIGAMGYISSEVVRWLGNRRLQWRTQAE